ncbi:Holliday junction branch migration protein RuvA [candidate division WWE3 bacterium]|uniref:Holliday junction branch migration complex subunit RuvA n=1 Tax=candidate division WWE3 bacterium TaxID=2053526 RepID=A0A955RW12_UNCKA|nr:Holliday junction branch migration protein RuvA [candidate division WWE3 bacterium]
MFSFISGKIKIISQDSLLVYTNHGLGYDIRVGKKALQAAVVDSDIELFTQVYIRDDYYEVYGFVSEDELRMFEYLTGISGVGPKMAIGVLGEHTVESIKNAILSEDIQTFTSVSGIGKKNASRIILELKPKMGSDASLSNLTEDPRDSELLEALKALGYTEKEIKPMMKDIPSDVSLDEQVKLALRK